MTANRTSEMGIAELARRAGVTPRTVRYYVAEGLLPPAGGQGQRRAYGSEHLRRLEAIRHLKAAYLPLHEIRRRLGMPAAGASEDASRAQSAQSDTVGPERDQLAWPTLSAGSVAASADTSPPLASETRQGRPQDAEAGAGYPASRADARPTFGFGGAPQLGRIEIFEDVETRWRRVILAPGVELHYREQDNPHFIEAIQRLVREAPDFLDRRRQRRPVNAQGSDEQAD